LKRRIEPAELLLSMSPVGSVAGDAAATSAVAHTYDSEVRLPPQLAAD
jgi:hypothetical protein